jgi:hypothetical protein
VGGLTHRKGIDIVLRAYREAFTADDDVVLVIKEFDPGGFYAPISFRDVAAILAGDGRPSYVRLPPELPAEELPGLYTACTALVHPYRAEGFCLPLAEAMACGLPVITTDKGGPSAFATSQTATVLPSVLLHLPSRDLGRRQLSNFPGWREASRPHLVAAMREVYETPERLVDKATDARACVTTKFTWDRSADTLIGILEASASAPPRSAAGRPRMEDAQTLVARADALLRAGDVDGAAAGFHRGLGPAVIAPEGAAARVASAALAGLGRVASIRGIAENAYLFHRMALQRTPEDRALALAYATHALAAGHVTDAMQVFERLFASVDGRGEEAARGAILDGGLGGGASAPRERRA